MNKRIEKIQKTYLAGHLRDAIIASSNLLSERGDSFKVLKMCAQYYNEAGDIESAEKYYKLILAKFPNWLKAKFSCMSYLLLNADYSQAYPLYQEILQSEKYGNVFFEKARVNWLILNQDYDNAQKYSLHFINLFPNQNFGYHSIIDMGHSRRSPSDFDLLIDFKNKFEQKDGFHPILDKIYKKFCLFQQGLERARHTDFHEQSIENRIKLVFYISMCSPFNTELARCMEFLCSKELNLIQLRRLLAHAQHSLIVREHMLYYVNNHPRFLDYISIQKRLEILKVGEDFTSQKDRTSVHLHTDGIKSQNYPVDVVYSWVDLSDPNLHDLF